MGMTWVFCHSMPSHIHTGVGSDSTATSEGKFVTEYHYMHIALINKNDNPKNTHTIVYILKMGKKYI